MSSADDIANLFKQFGGKAADYKELGQDNNARESRDRWPLLSSVGEDPAAPIPSVEVSAHRPHAPATRPVFPATVASPAATPVPAAAPVFAPAPLFSAAPVAPPPFRPDPVFSQPTPVPAQPRPLFLDRQGGMPAPVEPPPAVVPPPPAATPREAPAPMTSTPGPARRQDDLHSVFARLSQPRTPPEARRNMEGVSLLRKLLRP